MHPLRITALSLLLACSTALSASPLPEGWQTFGRGRLSGENGTVRIADEWAADMTPRDACRISFKARMPQDAAQVQIWGVIRAKDRNARYVFALRGGSEPEISLARYAPDNHSRFLGFAPLLDFVPKPGETYALRVEAAGNRFQVYLNDEKLPRLNVEDKDAEWTSGGAGIGGGWLPAEFSDMKIAALEGDDLARFKAAADSQWAPPAVDKEALRASQRAAYQPAKVEKLPALRGEFSLNGDWLFQPDAAAGTASSTAQAAADLPDDKWHVLPVPSFWSPTLGWLHGEDGLPGLRGLSASKGPSDRLVAEENARVNALTFDWKNAKSGWYRHHLVLPASLDDRQFLLSFDAVAKVAEIYVNGVQVGANVGMFRRIECDATAALKPGENVIAVHVADNPANTVHGSDKAVATAVTVEVTDDMIHSLPHGMTAGDPVGIWQPVKLVVTKPVRAKDVFIQPRLDGASAEVELLNGDAKDLTVDLSYSIRDWKDQTPLLPDTKAGTVTVPAHGKATVKIATPELHPKPWSPQYPNLYVLKLDLAEGGAPIDTLETRFGFRTFAVSGPLLLLNGQPFWLRGGNHFPATLRPNDEALARKFIGLARDGNVQMTRSHSMPFTQTWLDACDELGMGVSYEGTWPWLLIKGEPPSAALLKAWKDEFSSLLEENRNHPSVLMWTVNNEMNFGRFDEKDTPLLDRKWAILSDMIRTMREIDPTRPVVAYSGYTRNETQKGFQDVVAPKRYDDGDIDDTHRYFGWYNESFFHLFDGEFGAKNAVPGRPLISQEIATGYPRNDDWPSRSYEFPRHVPQALVGDYAMEGSDPSVFITRQAFMTKELTETIRRTDRENAAGLLPFAYLTWFTDVWKADKIAPKPAYYAIKKAMEPVLVSVELYGRHFYAGETAARRVCLVNDDVDQKDLPAGTLDWEIRTGDAVLAKGSLPTPGVPYYANRWVDASFALPAQLPSPRTNAKLVVALTAGGKTYPANEYDLLLATKEWASAPLAGTKLQVLDPSGKASATLAGLDTASVSSIGDASTASPLIVGDPAFVDGAKLRAFAEAGGRVLLIQPGEALAKAFPDLVKGYRKTEGEIATMQVPESPVFDGIEPLDTAWFEMGPKILPRACTGTWQVDRTQADVTTLATQCDLHSELKPEAFFKTAGSPLVELRFGKGVVLASEFLFSAKDRDPVAARLLANALAALAKADEAP